MSKQTDSDTEGMTAEQLAAANERLAKTQEQILAVLNAEVDARDTAEA
jgi:hypothetical protein